MFTWSVNAAVWHFWWTLKTYSNDGINSNPITIQFWPYFFMSNRYRSKQGDNGEKACKWMILAFTDGVMLIPGWRAAVSRLFKCVSSLNGNGLWLTCWVLQSFWQFDLYTCLYVHEKHMSRHSQLQFLSSVS